MSSYQTTQQNPLHSMQQNETVLGLIIILLMLLFACFVQILVLEHEVLCDTYGVFVWDQSGIRIIGIIQVTVRLAAFPIPEYLDFHSSCSAPRSRIAGIYSRIYSYSRIFPNERAP